MTEAEARGQREALTVALDAAARTAATPEEIRAALDVVVVDQTWGIAVKERNSEGQECVLFAAWADEYGWHESPDESLDLAVAHLAEQGWRPNDGPDAALVAFTRAQALHPPTRPGADITAEQRQLAHFVKNAWTRVAGLAAGSGGADLQDIEIVARALGFWEQPPTQDA